MRAKPMPRTDAGRNALMQALIGDDFTPFNNANARIGVGNGDDAFNVSQTDLQGGSKFRKGMENGFPTRTGNQADFRAVFASGEANFPWEEWAIFNAGAGGTMYNRKVISQGTKVSGQVWEFTVTVGIANVT